MIRAALLVTLTAMVGFGASAAQTSSPVRQTVWSGVFTSAQAEHGAVLFRQHCESCHGAELRGNEGPALVGPSFTRNWTGLMVRELFRHIKVAMPEDGPTSVSDVEKADILAFIFQKNGFTAGDHTLGADMAELGTIMFEGQNGPEPPPIGATVLAVGCLTGGSGGWTLTQASEPVRTTLEAVHDPDVDETREKALGTATIRLIGMPASTLRDGQKVSVVGLMTRAAAPTQSDGINVLELSPATGECSR